jgi:hypothetical protein
MKLEPECVPCLLNQVYKAFKLLNHKVDRDLIITTQKKVMDFLLNHDFNELSSPLVGKYLYSLVGEMMNEEDPYKELKHEYNHLALSYYDDVKEFIAKAEDPVFEALIVSALGNTIDFASQHNIDIVKDLEEFSPEDLVINEYPLFKELLEEADKLLILLDNAGEIVFDKILIETLLNIYPNVEIIGAVRSCPIINDATIEDAKYISLTEIIKVIESSNAPGIDFSAITDDFKRYFFEEDCLILSKGQGNFETLTSVGDDNPKFPDKDIFYLLKAKCNLMERLFEVEQGSLIFKKRTPDF